jgi:hypothetical protein
MSTNREEQRQTARRSFTRGEALSIAQTLSIDLEHGPFDLDQFRIGLDVELEHGTRDLDTNVTGDDPILTGKIALAHLREMPDYYTRLALMEGELGGISTAH